MIRFLEIWLAVAESLSRWAARTGGALILTAALVVAVEVVLRKILSVSLGGADELTGYAFAIGTTWALAFTLLARANVRVDIVHARLPPKMAALLDLIAVATLIFFITVLTMRGFAVLQDTIQFRTRAPTPLATPLWIPQSLWITGYFLFLFAAVPLLLRSALAIVTGDQARAAALIGTRSVEEEASGEVSQAAHLLGASPPPAHALGAHAEPRAETRTAADADTSIKPRLASDR